MTVRSSLREESSFEGRRLIKSVVPSFENKVTLIVEDDCSVRHQLRDVLLRLGLRVIEADSGHSALELIDEGMVDHLDLAIVDILLPQGSGGAAAKRLLARFPTLPILYISGYFDAGEAAQALRDHRSRFLAKPFEPATLTWHVVQALSIDT